MSYLYSMIRLALLAALGTGLAACSDRNDAGTPAGPPRTDLGDVFVVTSTNRILSYALATPAQQRTAVAITGLDAGETILDIDARPKPADSDGTLRLYALSSTGKLHLLDPATGATTLVGTPLVPAVGANYAIDFNPLVDRLRVVSSTGDNLRVNPDTGGPAAADTALARADAAPLGVAGIAYSNNFDDGCATALYYVDPTTDEVLTTANPGGGVLTSVGALGVDATAVGGVDLVGGSGNALSLLTVGGTPGLYFINLQTGAATLRTPVAGLGAGETPVGLASVIVDGDRPLGDTAAVTAGDAPKIVTFNRADPTRICTTADLAILDADGEPIDGLTLKGIDVRQSDGTLYGLASDADNGGSIVTVDPATGEGAVVLESLVSNDGTGTATPVVLDGAAFGVDFNPVVDRLRIVSSSGQNLRVNFAPIDDPATTTVDESQFNTTVDGALNIGGVTQSNVAGAAYINSDPSAAAPTVTQLYYVKVDTDQLFTTTLPNAGTLTLVGGLGIDADLAAGFDIQFDAAGPDNTGFLVTNAPGVTTSSLYSVNLGTGAATLVNGIGTGALVPPGLLSAAAVIAP